MSDFCRVIVNGTRCDCEEYSPPVNPDPSQPALCAECLHGKSKHPKGAESAPLATPKSVLGIFKRLSGGAAGGGEEPKATVSEARSEIMKGYRKSSGSGSSRNVSKVSFNLQHDLHR
jgi:hypothetical protein